MVPRATPTTTERNDTDAVAAAAAVTNSVNSNTPLNAG